MRAQGLPVFAPEFEISSLNGHNGSTAFTYGLSFRRDAKPASTSGWSILKFEMNPRGTDVPQSESDPQVVGWHATPRMDGDGLYFRARRDRT